MSSSDQEITPNYEDLISLFREFREFQKPEVIDGVPDYSAAAMNKQAKELLVFKDKPARINPAGWPQIQQVDHHLVRAEITGLEDEANKLWQH